LSQIQTLLGHKRVDLLKMDIEGFERPVLSESCGEWPLLTDIRNTKALRMQMHLEIHYQMHMPALTHDWRYKYTLPTDMVRLQQHLWKMKMGYGVPCENAQVCSLC
jgi:hypothetical protein